MKDKDDTEKDRQYVRARAHFQQSNDSFVYKENTDIKKQKGRTLTSGGSVPPDSDRSQSSNRVPFLSLELYPCVKNKKTSLKKLSEINLVTNCSIISTYR